MSWSGLLRLLLIAVALTLAAGGLIAFIARPAELTGLLAAAVGGVMGVMVVPRDHWPRAIVGVCTFAAILALVTILRVLAGTYIEREMQPDAGLLWRLGASMLFFLPFVWWRKHRSCEPKEAVHCDLDLIRSVDGFVTPGELTSGEPLEPR